MKRILAIWAALFIVVYHAASQEWDEELPIFENFKEEQRFADLANPLRLFLALHADDEESIEGYNKLIDKLDKKSSKKHHVKWFLEEVFYKSHQLLLKDYKKHSTFNNMLKDGSYDCVSGSALLGLLLDRYGFDYRIVETDFHVFVLVYHGEDTYVMESTEPRGGFMTDQEAVSAYIASFEPSKVRSGIMNNGLAGRSLTPNESQNTIYNFISLKELAGLQYYNDAIHHFNENDMKVVRHQLIKAAKIYPSDRVMNFYAYISSQKETTRLARR